MRKTPRGAKLVALLSAGALALAACGSDSNDTTTEDSTAETTAPTEDTEAATEDTEAATEDTAAAEEEEAAAEAAMRVTYTLSDTAVWDDGSAISAADFECTYLASLNTPGSLSTTGYDQIISVAEGASAQEVVVELSTVYAPWKSLFSTMLKADAHEDCNDVSEDFAGGISYSAREWIADSWTPEQIVYVPNPGYTGAKKPAAQKIVIVPAEDGPTLLKSGAVDFIYPQAYTGIDAELADPNVAMDSALGGQFEALYFQQAEGPFADPIYREAFSKSIDRDALFEQIYAPFAQGAPLLTCGPIAPGPYCNDAFAGGYDPAGAAALLEENGWTKGADGMWVNPDGEVPEVRWMVNTGNTRRESTQEYLIPKLAEAGFNVRADNCEALPCVFETRLPSLDYDLAMYISTVAPDPAYLTQTNVCDQIPSEENEFKGQNSTGWCNEEASAMLYEADATVDEAKRIELVQGAIQLMADDFVLIPTLQFPNIGAWRTDKTDGVTAELANYRAISDWYQWKDVDGDGQIVIGAEQFAASDCPNPITECSNSSWFVWTVSFPVLPGAYDTTKDQTFAPGEILAGEAVVEVL